jgi:hypothetical protein
VAVVPIVQAQREMFVQDAMLVIHAALDLLQLSVINRVYVHEFLNQIFQMTLQAKSSRRASAQNY